MTKYTTRDFAAAEFARRKDGIIAIRGHAPFGGRPWSTAGWVEYTDAQMSLDGGWAPVLECPAPEQHDDRYVSPLAVKRVQEGQARAEKAEQERDEARAGARAAFARCREVEKARQEVVDELYSLRVAEPRPLAPDANARNVVDFLATALVNLADEDRDYLARILAKSAR